MSRIEIHTWATKPNSADPTWPIAGVPAPEYPAVTTVDGDKLTVRYVQTVFTFYRKPAADYWPDDATCAALANSWADVLRRYVKNNPLHTIVFLTGVDPEGRHRCLGEPMPDHVKRWLQYADSLRSGRSTLKGE